LKIIFELVKSALDNSSKAIQSKMIFDLAKPALGNLPLTVQSKIVISCKTTSENQVIFDWTAKGGLSAKRIVQCKLKNGHKYIF
jgi:hypothetical protein